MTPPGPDTPAARPEPVLEAGRVAGTISALVVSVGSLASLFGLALTAEDVNRAAAAVAGAVTAVITVAAWLIPLWRARKARAFVTPLADPRDDDGTPLVADLGDGATGQPLVRRLRSRETPGPDHAAGD